MATFLSSRLKNLKVGIQGYTDSTEVASFIGNVNIDGSIKTTTFDDGSSTGLNNYVITANGSGGWSWQSISTVGAITSPGGTDGQVQYNNGGDIGGAAQLYYDDVNSRVGIGTTAPGYLFEVDGDASFLGIIRDGDGDAGANGQILMSTGSGVNWVNAAPANAITGLNIKEEGTLQGGANAVATLDFVGSYITATVVGSTATITMTESPNFTGLTVNSNTVWHEGNDGAGSGLDADKLDGQEGSYYLDYTNFTNVPTIGNGLITISTGTGLTGSGNFTVNQSGATTITVSHADTSTQTSVNNANGAVIQDITLDGFGHITAIGSVDLDGRYYTETEADGRFLGISAKAADSELLDGQDSTYYLNTSATAQTKSGDLTLSSDLVVSGNVGIGTVTPTEKFHVEGQAYISETLNVGTAIDIVPYNALNGGTLSFEGSAGQLFSVTNNLTSGSIFSVNDVSGIPSFNVDADGTVSIAAYGGDVGVGTEAPSEKLDVVGSVKASEQFISSVATGTAPLSVASTTLVSNFNADLLDGQQGSYYLNWNNVTNKPSPVVTVTLSGDVTGTANTTLTNLGNGTISIATTIAANSVALGTDTVGDYVEGISAGSGIVVGGTSGEGWTATVSHADTSSQASVNNSNGNVIQDITLDGFGHITAIGSIDLDGRYLGLTAKAADSELLDGQDGSYYLNTSTTFGGDVSGTYNAIVVANDSHTHDGRYYTETESDARFLRKDTSDTLNGNLTLTGELRGPATFVLDPAAVGDNTGTLVIRGNLQVDGVTTTINSTVVSIDDKNIVLASGAADAAAADGAGITIDGASATLTYATGGDSWVFNKAPYYNSNRLLTTADEGSGNGLDADTLDGQEGSYYRNASNINAGTIGDAYLPATISSDITGNAATATKLATSRTIALSGDVTGSVGFDGSANVTINATVANDSHTHDGRYYTEAEADARFLGINAKAADSELLDGINSTSFLRSDANDDFTGTLWGNNVGGTYFNLRGGSDGNTLLMRVSAADANEDISANLGSDFGFNIRYRGDLSGVENALQIDADNQSGSAIEALRIKQNGVVYFGPSPYVGSNVIWHAGNDGAGTGLDADLLDGQQGSYYLNTSTTFGGDVSGTYNAIVVANDSHTHDTRYYTETESDARFLGINAKAADSDLLDGQDSTYYRDASNINAGTIGDAYLPATISSDITGNAATATKLATARTIALAGDVTGSASFDGSANISITATVVNDSHNHDSRYYTEAESDARFLGINAKAADSELLDGINSTSFLRSDQDDTTTGKLTAKTLALTNNATDTSDHRITVYDSGDGVSYGMMLWNSNGTSGDWSTMIYGPNQSARRISFGKVNTTSFINHASVTEIAYFDLDDSTLRLDADAYVGSNVVWNAGNDGSGSGLDADTIDGIQASSFLRSDANDSASGTYIFSGGGNDVSNTPTFELTAGYISISHDEVLLKFDQGQKMITSNDSAGNFNIRSGHDNDQLHVSSPSGDSGMAAISLASDGTPGEIHLYVGPQRTAGSIAYADYGLSIERGISGLSWKTGSDIYGGNLATGYKIWHAGNDGSGSGLDADTLDGLQSTQFLRADSATTFTGGILTLNSATPEIHFNGTSDSGIDMAIKATPEGLDFYEPEDSNRIHFRIYDDTGVDSTFGYWINGTRVLDSSRQLSNVTYGGNTIWHAGNDGSGSGLDADLLDGQQGSYYLDTSATTQTKSGGLNVSGNVGIGTTNPLQKLHIVDPTSANVYIETKNATTGSTAGVFFRTSDSTTENGFFKTGIVLEDDGTSFARGKLHILQGNTADDSNATIADSVVTINQSGNVGIGTTNPLKKLHVSNGTSGYSITNLDDAYIVARFEAADSRVQIASANTGGEGSSLILSNSDKHWIVDAKAVDLNNRFDIGYYDSSVSNSGNWNGSKSTYFTIETAGNVGIGTTDPQAKIHIETGTASTGASIGIIGKKPLFNNNTAERYGALNIGDWNTLGQRTIVSISSRQSGITGSQYFENGGDIATLRFTGTGTDGASGFVASEITANTTSSGFGNSGTTPSNLLFKVSGSGGTGSTPVERMRISGNGNVGIGTTNPSQKLHVIGAALITLDIQLTGSNPRIDFNSNGSSALRFWDTANNIERARIDTSGRLLVGTTSDIGGYLHQVDSAAANVASFTRYAADAANVRIGSSRGTQTSRTALGNGDFGGIIQFDGYTGSAFSTLARIGAVCDGQAPANGNSPGRLVFLTTASGASSSTERMRITKDGNVGIGTDNPKTKIDSRGNILVATNTNGNNILAFGNSDSYGPLSGAPDSSHGSAFIIGNSTTAVNAPSYLSFWTTGGGNVGERLRIDSAGNVGIGTTNPSDKLHIWNSATTGQIRIGGANGSGNHRVYINSHPTSSYLDSYGNNAYAPFKIAANPLILNTGSAGNVGIGTDNPQSKLHVEVVGSTTSSTNLSEINDVGNSNVSRTFKVGSREGTNAPGYSAFGVSISSSADNSSQNKQSVYLMLGSRDPSLNGLHGSQAYQVFSTPDAQGTYGTGQLDFYIRNSVAYGIPNDPAVSSQYWMPSLFTIKSSGNVGIGTTDPQQKLHIMGPARIESSAPFIELNDATTSTSSYRVGVSQYVEGDFYIAKYSGSAWQYDTFYIDESKRIGIGTTNPDTQAKLDVRGNLLLQCESASAPNRLMMYPGISNLEVASRIEFWEGAPTSTYADANASIEYNANSTYGGDGAILIRGNTSSANQIIAGFSRSGNSFFTGNVGIGTTNPSTKLHVNGTLLVEGTTNFNIASEGTGSYFRIFQNNNYDINNLVAVNDGNNANNWNKDGNYGLKLRNSNNSIVFSVGGITNQRIAVIQAGHENPAYAASLAPLRLNPLGGNVSVGDGGLNVSGNVGIGTDNPQYKLEVNGSFAATTKSFVIPHPTKEGYKLRHGSLEGPENGVYVRGRSKDFIIELPDYWVKLVDADSITVNLTPVGKSQTLWVKDIKDNKVYVGSKCSEVHYFYTVFAERVDVERLQTEINCSEVV